MLPVFAGIVLAFLIIPVLILVPVSLSSVGYLVFPPPGLSWRWFHAVFADRGWLGSFALSLRVAGWVALLSTALGTGAAVGLVRGALPARKTIYVVLLAPLVVPTIITAIGLYFVFARLHLVGNVTAIVLGQAVLNVPIVTILVAITLQGLDPQLEYAAEIHGASPLRTFLRVVLPLISPGVVAAALFAFLGSFDELLVALFVAGPLHQTLPMRIWNTVQFELDPSVATVSVMVTTLAVAILALGAWLQSRRPAETRE